MSKLPTQHDATFRRIWHGYSESSMLLLVDKPGRVSIAVPVTGIYRSLRLYVIIITSRTPAALNLGRKVDRMVVNLMRRRERMFVEPVLQRTLVLNHR